MAELNKLLNFMSSWDRQAVLEDYAQRLAAAEDPCALMKELGSPVVVASRLGRGYVPSPSPYAPPEPEPEPAPEPEEDEEEELPPLPPREKPEKPKDENSFASLAELLEAASCPEFWEESAWGCEPKLETFQLEPEAETQPEETAQNAAEPQPQTAEETPDGTETERWKWDPEALELVPAQAEAEPEAEPEPEPAQKAWTWSWGEAVARPTGPDAVPEKPETPPEGAGEAAPPQLEAPAMPEPEAPAVPVPEAPAMPEPEAPAVPVPEALVSPEPEVSAVPEPILPAATEPETPAAREPEPARTENAQKPAGTDLGAFIDPAAFPNKSERFPPEMAMPEPEAEPDVPTYDDVPEAEPDVPAYDDLPEEALPRRQIPQGGLTQFLLRCLVPGLPTVLGILALGLPFVGLGLFGLVFLLRLGTESFHLYRLWSDRLLLIGLELPVLALCLVLIWLGLWIILRLLRRWSRQQLCPWWKRWIAGQEDE